MKKTYIVYLAAVVGIYVAAVIISGGSIWYFLDVPTFVLTPVLPLILMLGHFSPREMLDSFRCAGTAERSEAETRKALVFFTTLHRLIIISGLLATMLGVVMILVIYPSEHFNSNIGKYMAVCFLSLVYPLFLIMTITVPFTGALRKKLIG
ncbi:MAG: hypothetical protein KBA61_12380 [Spirochaetes bacterium]|nr:hypothetical protein [Spirochaetota bacterium]HPA71853.1 hypothetical protein [Spirochaetota bacterium]